jgi:hypothetical protein
MTNTIQTDKWPNITELLDQVGGHISIGRMPPIKGAAIAVNDQTLVTSLVRREKRGFLRSTAKAGRGHRQGLPRNVVTNEINGGRFRLAPSGIRKKR